MLNESTVAYEPTPEQRETLRRWGWRIAPHNQLVSRDLFFEQLIARHGNAIRSEMRHDPSTELTVAELRGYLANQLWRRRTEYTRYGPLLLDARGEWVGFRQVIELLRTGRGGPSSAALAAVLPPLVWDVFGLPVVTLDRQNHRHSGTGTAANATDTATADAAAALAAGAMVLLQPAWPVGHLLPMAPLAGADAPTYGSPPPRHLYADGGHAWQQSVGSAGLGPGSPEQRAATVTVSLDTLMLSWRQSGAQRSPDMTYWVQRLRARLGDGPLDSSGPPIVLTALTSPQYANLWGGLEPERVAVAIAQGLAAPVELRNGSTGLVTINAPNGQIILSNLLGRNEPGDSSVAAASSSQALAAADPGQLVRNPGHPGTAGSFGAAGIRNPARAGRPPLQGPPEDDRQEGGAGMAEPWQAVGADRREPSGSGTPVPSGPAAAGTAPLVWAAADQRRPAHASGGSERPSRRGVDSSVLVWRAGPPAARRNVAVASRSSAAVGADQQVSPVVIGNPADARRRPALQWPPEGDHDHYQAGNGVLEYLVALHQANLLPRGWNPTQRDSRTFLTNPGVRGWLHDLLVELVVTKKYSQQRAQDLLGNLIREVGSWWADADELPAPSRQNPGTYPPVARYTNIVAYLQDREHGRAQPALPRGWHTSFRHGRLHPGLFGWLYDLVMEWVANDTYPHKAAGKLLDGLISQSTFGKWWTAAVALRRLAGTPSVPAAQQPPAAADGHVPATTATATDANEGSQLAPPNNQAPAPGAASVAHARRGRDGPDGRAPKRIRRQRLDEDPAVSQPTAFAYSANTSRHDDNLQGTGFSSTDDMLNEDQSSPNTGAPVSGQQTSHVPGLNPRDAAANAIWGYPDLMANQEAAQRRANERWTAAQRRQRQQRFDEGVSDFEAYVQQQEQLAQQHVRQRHNAEQHAQQQERERVERLRTEQQLVQQRAEDERVRQELVQQRAQQQLAQQQLAQQQLAQQALGRQFEAELLAHAGEEERVQHVTAIADPSVWGSGLWRADSGAFVAGQVAQVPRAMFWRPGPSSTLVSHLAEMAGDLQRTTVALRNALAPVVRAPMTNDQLGIMVDGLPPIEVESIVRRLAAALHFRIQLFTSNQDGSYTVHEPWGNDGPVRVMLHNQFGPEPVGYSMLRNYFGDPVLWVLDFYHNHPSVVADRRTTGRVSAATLAQVALELRATPMDPRQAMNDLVEFLARYDAEWPDQPPPGDQHNPAAANVPGIDLNDPGVAVIAAILGGAGPTGADPVPAPLDLAGAQASVEAAVQQAAAANQSLVPEMIGLLPDSVAVRIQALRTLLDGRNLALEARNWAQQTLAGLTAATRGHGDTLIGHMVPVFTRPFPIPGTERSLLRKAFEQASPLDKLLMRLGRRRSGVGDVAGPAPVSDMTQAPGRDGWGKAEGSFMELPAVPAATWTVLNVPADLAGQPLAAMRQRLTELTTQPEGQWSLLPVRAERPRVGTGQVAVRFAAGVARKVIPSVAAGMAERPQDGPLWAVLAVQAVGAPMMAVSEQMPDGRSNGPVTIVVGAVPAAGAPLRWPGPGVGEVPDVVRQHVTDYMRRLKVVPKPGYTSEQVAAGLTAVIQHTASSGSDLPSTTGMLRSKLVCIL